MENKSQDEMITEEIGNLMTEAFEQVGGFFLDKGTSLFELIETINAEEASAIPAGSETSIAGHLGHVSFFMKTIIGYNTGQIKEKTDWSKSWTINEVDDKSWSSIKKELRDSYKMVRENMDSITYWKDVDDFSGILSILAHSSFHLGFIYKMISQIRA